LVAETPFILWGGTEPKTLLLNEISVRGKNNNEYFKTF
jgi:hypothetical protein